MPNLNFYAFGEDFRPVLEHVFTRLGCRVFESGSKDGRELREFSRTEDVMPDLFGPTPKGGTVFLQILVPSASALFKVRRIDYTMKRIGMPDHRYEIEGWGLIQLHLLGNYARGLDYSRTNHFSPERAATWAAIRTEVGDPGAWNWREVRSVSGSLNRFVQKAAVGKIASHPVLPAAHGLFLKGVLPQFIPDRDLLASYLSAAHGLAVPPG